LHPITPPGKKQKVYPKKEVDELKTDLEAWSISRHLVKAPPTEFVRAMASDMPQAVALADAVFGGVNTISLETRFAWLDEHHVLCYSMSVEGKVVGYAFFLPLEPGKTGELLPNGKFIVEEFLVEDENGEA
jgi:hypothetical protein